MKNTKSIISSKQANRIFLKCLILLLTVSIFSCQNEEETIVMNIEDLTPEISEITPLKGEKNSLVTINGHNFGTDSTQIKIYFNEKQAEILSVTNEKIETKVPRKANTGNLKVIINETELSGGVFTYKIAHFELPISGTVCHISGISAVSPGDTLTFDYESNFETLDVEWEILSGSMSIIKINKEFATFKIEDDFTGGQIWGGGINADFPKSIYCAEPFNITKK